jgi:thiaminase/transcriptional activator TenA
MERPQSFASTLWTAPRSRKLARDCLLHPFIQSLGAGSLGLDSFRIFVEQDAFFLDAFSRSFEAAATCAKSAGFQDVERCFLKMKDATIKELEMHSEYAKTLGCKIEKVKPMPATEAYTGFLSMLAEQSSQSTGSWRNLARLCCGLAPCMRLYAWLGATLATGGFQSSAGEILRKWIDEYSSSEFQANADEHDKLLNICWSSAVAEMDDTERAALMHELAGLYLEALMHELAFFHTAGLQH